MWKPNEVVPEHKTRARFVWAGLLFSILAYTIWQTVTIALERQNPTTSLTVSNDQYEFPYVRVCMWEYQGCSDVNVTACVLSALDWGPYVTYNEDDPVEGFQSEREGYSHCIEFDLTSFNVIEEEEQGLRARARLEMVWVSSEATSGDTFYTEQVGVYLGPSADEMYEFTYVPYSRVIISENFSYSFTDMTIGKTTRKNIAGDKTTTYPVLTLSTAEAFQAITEYGSPTTPENEALGALFLDITQGSYSLSNIKEIDPLEIGTLLGNIGGFWELLIIVWGLCFIGTIQQRGPTLKARNFVKPIQQRAKIVTRRRRQSASALPSSESREKRPQWDAPYRGPTVNSMQSARDQEPGALSNPSDKRPVPIDLPQRTSSVMLSKASPGGPINVAPPSHENVQHVKQRPIDGELLA